MAGPRTGDRAELRPGWAGGWGLAGVQGPLAFQTKPSSYQGLVTRGFPLCLYVEAVCGQTHGKPKSERKMTKGEREEYRGPRGSKCSWKIKAPNKNQQNGKKANRRSKAREQNAGREVSAKELISQTYESLTLKQEYHSPGSWLWSPLVIMGAMKRPWNKALSFFLCERRGPGPMRTSPCAGFEGDRGPWPREWGASEWAGTWLTPLESSEASTDAYLGRARNPGTQT